MFLSNLKKRDLGLMNCLQDSFSEIFLSNLCCNRRDTFSCSSKGLETSVLEVPPFVAKFSPVSSMEHILLLASEEGEIIAHNTLDKNDSKPCGKINAHDNAIFDICWMREAPTFITASGDKTAAIWDFPSQKKILQLKGHQCSIKSVDVRPNDDAVFVTGGRDGNIMLWDTRCVYKNNPGHAVNVLRNVHKIREPTSQLRSKNKFGNESYHGVTAVLFQDSNILISSGAVDGDIKFWDIRRSYGAYRSEPFPVKNIPYPGSSVKQLGYTSLILDSNGNKLFANCTDNVIYEYNCSTCKLDFKYNGHKSSSFFVKSTLCPRNRFLLSGSMDEYAYIWKVGGSNLPLYRLNGHRDEVTSVDWCKSDDVKIVTCCDDMKYRIWRLETKTNFQAGEGEVERIKNLDAANVKATYSRRVKQHFSNNATCQSPLQEINRISTKHVASPTLNLPNLVLDQHTPEDTVKYKVKSTLRCSSNWLTKISANHRVFRGTSNKYGVAHAKKERGRTRIDKCLENYFKIV